MLDATARPHQAAPKEIPTVKVCRSGFGAAAYRLRAAKSQAWQLPAALVGWQAIRGSWRTTLRTHRRVAAMRGRGFGGFGGDATKSPSIKSAKEAHGLLFAGSHVISSG
eukprot:Skav209289  [mRNA]  locus=scaffold251:123599:128775:+ [translate_table: standard]